MMLPQWEFLYDLEDLMKQKGDFYPENNENTDDLIKKFTTRYPNEKINSFMDLKKILNVELENSKREQQAKVINFIIENLCKKDIIESERQMDDLVKVLRDKFGDSQVIIILKKLKEKELKINAHLEFIITTLGINLNRDKSIQNNPKYVNKNLDGNKNLNVSPKKYKNDKSKNNDQKSVYEKINNNQVNQNPGPAPQIKIHDNLDKGY